MKLKLLSIDTALSNASVCVRMGEEILALDQNNIQKNHASWLHPAIAEAMAQAGFRYDDLDLLSVAAGPGSYTGLRVGLSAAKGICYARKKPLVLLNSLDIMADAAREKADADVYCPMIDARRMEVYTAAYDRRGKCLMEPCALVLDQFSFQDLLKYGKILHFGDGSIKFRDHLQKSIPNFAFAQLEIDARNHYQLSLRRFTDGDFADLAYSEPLYLKEFHSTQRK